MFRKTLIATFIAALAALALVTPGLADFVGNITLGRDGDAQNPVITFASEADLGFYRSGANTLELVGGNLVVNGTVSSTGVSKPFGVRVAPIKTDAATLTLVEADCGKAISAEKATLTQTFTLPSAALGGCTYTFIAGHAGGEILINPIAAQTVNIMTWVAVGVDADTGRVAPAAGTGVKNTAATNVLGDTLQLVADGTTSWYSVAITNGIWATQ